jgi:hypothetical protein
MMHSSTTVLPGGPNVWKAKTKEQNTTFASITSPHTYKTDFLTN